VETDPAGATVWADEQIIGTAPVQLTVPRGTTLNLRISHPSCEQWTMPLTAKKLPASRHFRVRLIPKPSSSIKCISRPPGADLFLDGEYRGQTPLQLKGLAPRTIELTFRMKNRRQAARIVDLDGTEPEKTVEVDLESLTEEYYWQHISRDPRNMTNYADLAHHYMLEKRYTEATGVLEKAIETVLTRKTKEEERLWYEIKHIVDAQFAYGNDAEVRKARALVQGLLAKFLKKHPRGPLRLYHSYILALDIMGEREKAQEIFDLAWRKYRGAKVLRVLVKNRNFRIP